MHNVETDIKKIVSLMGLGEARVTVDDEHHKISLMIDDRIASNNIPLILPTRFTW
jgi:hypothetical protein